MERRKDDKIPGAGAGVAGGEVSAAVDKRDQGDGEGDEAGGGEQSEGGDAGDGVGHAGGELVFLLFGPEAGEEGHGRQAGSLRQHGNRCGEQALGVGHHGDGAVGRGGEVVDDPGVGGDQGDADHERQRELDPLAQAGVVPVENGAVARAGAVREECVEQKWADDGAGQRAIRQRRYAEAMNQEDAAEDGAHAVDERGDGLNGELLAHQEHRAEDTAGKEEQLRGQQDAREVDAERGFGRVKTVEPPVHEQGGEKFGDEDGRAEHEKHGVEDDGERTLAFNLAALTLVACEDGDERDGGRAANQEVSNHVRELKRCQECVRLHAASKDPGDVHVAQHTEETGHGREDHQDDGGGECGVGVSGLEDAQNTGQARGWG